MGFVFNIYSSLMGTTNFEAPGACEGNEERSALHLGCVTRFNAVNADRLAPIIDVERIANAAVAHQANPNGSKRSGHWSINCVRDDVR